MLGCVLHNEIPAEWAIFQRNWLSSGMADPLERTACHSSRSHPPEFGQAEDQSGGFVARCLDKRIYSDRHYVTKLVSIVHGSIGDAGAFAHYDSQAESVSTTNVNTGNDHDADSVDSDEEEDMRNSPLGLAGVEVADHERRLLRRKESSPMKALRSGTRALERK
jgi:hypothetical protein